MSCDCVIVLLSVVMRVLKIIPADKVVNSHIFIKYCRPTVARVLFLIPAINPVIAKNCICKHS